jgi:hypothetical protein
MLRLEQGRVAVLDDDRRRREAGQLRHHEAELAGDEVGLEVLERLAFDTGHHLVT